jgi:hypothetical protein
MMAERTTPPFGRVLVAFDTTPQGNALLTLAAELALCFDSPLAGLFVEDESALLYADLPIAREVSLVSAAIRDLSRERMQTHFRAQARIARQALDAVALRHSVASSFLSRKGRVLTVIAAQAEKRDLLLVSPRVGVTMIPGHEDLLHGLIGSAAAGLMALGDPRRVAWHGPVAAVLGADETKTASAIAIAGAIAVKRGVPLCLFIVGQDDLPESNIERIRALLSHPDEVRIGTLPAEEPIPTLFSRGDPSLVVLSEGLSEDAHRELLRHGTPVLLVR